MDYETPKNQMHSPRIYVERTLALIKPDAIHQAEEIEDIILRSGFTILQPIPMGEAAKDYLGRFVSPTLLSGLTELCKQKPVDPFTWLADWLVRHNPNKPQIFDGATGEEAA
uniref:Nucleoside diphosphate kinase homolog 5 n=1 Tax=Oncorhynchus kisutch TaxID=8019 RepID=A0A8C7K1D0_ONCKI